MGALSRDGEQQKAPLQRFAAHVEELFAAGDDAALVKVLEHDFVAMWFAFSPNRLAEILRALAERDANDTGVAQATFQAVFGDSFADVEDRLSSESGLQRLESLHWITDVFKLRMSGQPARALRLVERFDAKASRTV